MKLARRLLIGLTAVSVLAIYGCSDSTDPDDDIVQNRVYLTDSVSVNAGDHFAVPVTCENAQPIRALALPLGYPVEVLDCDSISFVGSRVADWDINTSSLDTEQGLIEIFRLTTGTPLGVGRGLLATLYLRAPGVDPTVDLTIDTTWISHNVQLHFTGLVAGDTLIIPEFSPCHLHIDSIQ